MEAGAISALIIRSAKQYCEYLGNKKKREDRGEEVHDVRDIASYSNGVVMLRLFNGLTDISLTAIEIKGKRIDQKLYKYRSYDDLTKTLEMQVDPTIQDEFREDNKDNIKVIFDFKFLIDRIVKYLEKYGEYLEFPIHGAHPEGKIDLPPGLNPSEDQIKAIATSMTAPASYIWGAPGTGKTQFVLANSILADIKAGRKVAVFAPTNNSVEQILRGLIKEIDENKELKDHINLDKDILRVGAASSVFQATFPKMCEQRRVDKQGKVLKHTLKALWDTKNEMVIDSKTKAMINLRRKAEKYDSLSDAEKDSVEDEFMELVDSFKRIHVMTVSLQQASPLDIKGSLERMIDAAINRPRPRRYMPEYADYTIERMDALIHNVEQEYKHMTGKSPYKTRDIVMDQNFESAYSQNEVSQVPTSFRKRKERPNDDKAKSLLEKGSVDSEETSASLESAKIIVCTPHQFFKRMIPACVPPEGRKHVLDVGHIYVDEAGYANLMHILPLLTNHVPITLLGDHMQLETVFTMGREEAISNIINGPYRLAFLWGTPAIHLEDMFAAKTTADLQEIYKNDLDPAFKMVKRNILKKSYRFGDNLAKMLDQYVYGNIGLIGASEDGNLEIECIPVSSDCQYVNPREAAIISKFISESDLPDSTAILTPYRRQRKEIHDQLPKKSRCEVMTIHSSQGREWDTVIVSVADSRVNEQSFMNSKDPKMKKVVNTAVSRAKHRLIIVCDFDKWKNQEGQLISALINYANDNGDCYTSIDEAVSSNSWGFDDDDDDY